MVKLVGKKEVSKVVMTESPIVDFLHRRECRRWIGGWCESAVVPWRAILRIGRVEDESGDEQTEE